MVTEKAVMLVIRTARPRFRNCQDKAAFAVHAAFMAAGYILHSTGLPAFEDSVLKSCSVTDEIGAENWNEVDEGYAFLYSHPEQGSKRVLMRGLVHDGKLNVDVLKEGEEEPHHLEVNTMKYVHENDGGTNYGSQFKNLAKLVANVNKELLSKLDGSSTPSSPNQHTSSTTTEVNLTGALQIQYAGPCCPPAPPVVVFTDPAPNPPHFLGGPAAGTMPHGPYPRYPQEVWRPRPRTPNNFDRAPGGRIGGRRRGAILPPRRLNLR